MKRGFSIVEGLISITILVMGILSVFGTYPAMLDLNMNSWERVQATELLQQKLEDITSVGTFISTSVAQDNPASLPNCTRKWVGSPDPNGNPNLQVITVDVQWTEKTGLGDATVSTYLTR